MRFGRGGGVRGVIALFVFVLAGFLAATSLGSHDPAHPFAGNWTISFQSGGGSGTFSFRLVGDAEGLAAMNATFATGPCEEPSDYYVGTYVDGVANTGTLAGCTTGDDRSIYAPYLPSSGVCCGFVIATLGPSGETFSGQNYWDFDGDGLFSLVDSFEGAFAGHFAGDGAETATTGGATTDEEASTQPSEEPESALVILKGKQFRPSEVTLVDGDILKICNRDPFYHRPFSLDPHGNTFTQSLRPKKCLTRYVYNATAQVIAVGIFDDFHRAEKLIVLVQPGGFPEQTFEGMLPSPPADDPREVEVRFEQRQFKPAAVVAKAGSSLVLCYLDPTGGRPFSFSLYNKFSARVRPGACLQRALRNPTDAKLTMRVYDDRFSGDRVRLAVTILPA